MAYKRHNWVSGEDITEAKLNNIEDGIGEAMSESALANNIAQLEKASSAQQNKIADKGREVIATIPSDYRKLQADVEQQKQDFNQLNSEINEIAGFISLTNDMTISSTGLWTAQGESTHVMLRIDAGDKVIIKANAAQPTIYGFLRDNYCAVNNYAHFSTQQGFTSRTLLTKGTTSAEITAPSDAKYLYVCVTANGNVSYAPTSLIINGLERNYGIREKIEYIISDFTEKSIHTNGNLDSGDLNDINYNSFYLMLDDKAYVNAPPVQGEKTGFLFTMRGNSNWLLQIWCAFDKKTIYKRRGTVATKVWSGWLEIGSETIINNYTNEYTTNHYESTYEINATPSITADTNNYLAPTGDKTDVTASIVTMLQNNKICRLGAGKYYVSGVNMPDDTAIIGCGASTEVILLGNDDGYAIKLNSKCLVENLSVLGAESNIAILESVGNRHGILWEGNANSTTETIVIPKYGMIRGCFISRFTGGGITCYNTGYNQVNSITASDCYINNCSVGINISYWSEFNRFSNISSTSNYYGCINNGGNNMFENCNFSNNQMGFLMDNAFSQSPNNSHGSAIGCVFNHTGDNTGIGIKILNCDNGFIFDACQIFFSQIFIKDSDGVIVSSTNFGANNCNINIDGGGAILFANNLHQAIPTKTINNNNNVHFTNCYVRSTGAVVE